MMRGSGLRYVHALNKGKNGLEADLERCQKEMISTGHVYKENFKPDSDSDADDDAYEKERKNNRALKIKRAADKSRKDGCKKSFDLWRVKKELSERATKSLYAVDKPATLEDENEAISLWIEVRVGKGGGARAGGAKRSKATTVRGCSRILTLPSRLESPSRPSTATCTRIGSTGATGSSQDTSARFSGTTSLPAAATSIRLRTQE
jgi:hypothetical protein